MSKIVVFLSLVISFISCSPPIELHSDDFGFSRNDVNDKQVVEYRGDLYSGKVIEEYPNGSGTYSEGIYLNGFRSGKFIEGEYDRHGNKQLRKEVNYLNAVKHGVQIKYDNKGKVVTKGEFKNGLKEGLWLEGTARGEYKNGQKNGLWIEEGRRGEYTNGEKEGDWFQLGNNGEVLYKHGSYLSGRENGVFKTYKFQNNQYVLTSHKEYKQGKIDGLDLSLKWSLIKKGQKEQKIYNLKYTYSHNGAIGSFAKVGRTRKDWVVLDTEEGNFYCKHKLQYNGKLYLSTYTTKEFSKYSWEQYRLPKIIDNRDCDDCVNLNVQMIHIFSEWVHERSDKVRSILYSDIETTLNFIGMTSDELIGLPSLQANLNKQPSDYQIDGYLIPLEGIQEVYELIEELDSVELKFQFETSLSISNEGPHCDLKRWNKGFSEWIDISHRIEEKGYFRCYWQSTIDTAYYPKMNLEEIKSYVKNNCDSYWYELIKDFDSINPFYINVGASMYNFKVRGKNPVTNEEIEKIFSLPIPMGC